MMCCGRDLPRRLGGSVAGRRRARLGGGCPLLLLVNNRGGCWDFGRLGALDLAQNNLLSFPVCVAYIYLPEIRNPLTLADMGIGLWVWA
ncbi:hypothetical protein SLEP1_g43428 [Rubroshorea leprosula]|uniref:Uncharacterized protein n=1 Tax=Rubroshorea leprosula TaxID=152421 RepID=A0AAV5LDC0_9ROSI|nr:hypothetical protein SLEP1_g43428 [Rubroshorea leprosula]